MTVHLCPHCKKKLSFIEHARGIYCQKPLCQRAKIQVSLVDNKKQLIAELTSQLKEYLPIQPVKNMPFGSHKERDEISPTIAFLPANSNQLVNLKQTRKQQFLQHLAVIYKDVKNNNPKGNRVYSEQLNTPLPEGDAKLVGNACATCMGSCCKHGQTHAFIDYPSLQHLLASQSTDLSEQTLLDLYSNWLPEKSYQYSCIFHGENGCALPRELRSFTCNNFLCEEITTYHHEVKNAGSSLTFAAAVNNNKIMFTSVYDDQNFIRVKEKQP